MNKINIAELLKDCPKGMELDCAMCDDVTFGSILDGNCYPILIQTPEGDMQLSKYGCMSLASYAKCVIFPKGKTTWEGFVPPCKFKDGDVLISAHGNPFILKEIRDNKICESYCGIRQNGGFMRGGYSWTSNYNLRLATEEEKARLFQAIKDNGYKWNAETKTLEKLIEPKFKVGDRVRNKNYKDYIYNIHDIVDKGYRAKEINSDSPILILFGSQEDNYELIPNKFDITTLKPFESRVLVRGADGDLWKPAIYGFSHSKGCYVVGGVYWKQCIPYEKNEHLRGKTDDCNNFYKTW